MILKTNRGNWTLIGLLAAAGLVAVVVAFVFVKGGGLSTVRSESPLLEQSSKKQTVVGKSLETAKASECRQRLDQIRKGIETYKATNATEANPPSLKDIGLGVSSDFFTCPVSHQPYAYDPSTGRVVCQTHPGY